LKEVIIVGQAVQDESVLSSLSKKFEVHTIKPERLAQELQLHPNAYMLWIHVDTVLHKGMLDSLSNVKYLISTTTGLTHISEEIQSKFSDRLISLKGRAEFLNNITSTAEHTWALIFWSLNYLPKAISETRNGLWHRQNNFRSSQLSSQILGVIGFGRLGKMVGKIGASLGMKVLVFDISSFAKNEALQLGYKVSENIQSLFEICTIISIHADQNELNKNLINKNVLSVINQPLLLINTSRARLVDENSIISEIESRPFLRYFTDVVGSEELGLSLTESKLWNLARNNDRVVITPHIGGATLEASQLCENRLLIDFLGRTD
jgi:D-3-phosphoglycerate dehydrogenase